MSKDREVACAKIVVSLLYHYVTLGEVDSFSINMSPGNKFSATVVVKEFGETIGVRAEWNRKDVIRSNKPIDEVADQFVESLIASSRSASGRI